MDPVIKSSESSCATAKKRFYSCFVPLCTNNSVRNPDKTFVIVPSDDGVRKKWFQAVGKEYKFIFKTVIYCCEDHFDLKNDADNTISTEKKLILKKDVVPYIFKCRETSEEKPEAVIVEQKKHEIFDSVLQAHPLDSSLKMDEESNVFSSKITRSARLLKNNLSDLLHTVHAQPVEQKKKDKIFFCDFQPRTDKHFESKRKTRFKVKTVREIRHSFEKDIYSYLPTELEKQQNVLLRKIRSGSSRDENTKTLAKNMLKCDKPVSRAAWQMLMNLNPEDCTHSTQFVLLNGKLIRVNGSKGGKYKFLCKYDLGEKKKPIRMKSSLKRKSLIKKKGLLQNSLSINFKPGPLTKKTLLDDSYQKYHVGDIELLKLPMPGLEIQPTIGKAVDPAVAKFLHNMQQADGTISDKWAEFSVSVLSTIKNENIVQCEDQSHVTFDLSYKCDQQRILMRRDICSDFHKSITKHTSQPMDITREDCVEISEIQKILDEMLHSVQISVEQENMYTGDDEPRIPEDTHSNGTNVLVKDKPKRKYGELEKLDVTIIRLSEAPDINPTNMCPKAHCALGCLCASLECALKFKRHCGRSECMFECKCDFSKYKVIDSFERDCSDLIPGLLNIDSAMSSKMAKEEQKFHQTVIVTSENSMLLKSKRRDWKSSRKYADFYSSMCLKAESKSDRVPAIALEKLKLDNVETWCMIHNLYKCFCKCIFTDNSVSDAIVDENKVNNFVQKNDLSLEKPNENVEKNNGKTRVSAFSQQDRIFSFKKSMKGMCDLFGKEPVEYFPDVIFDSESARVKPFTGRKYCNEHYLNANKKIIELEKHDHILRNRMMVLMNKCANESLAQADTVVEPVSDKTIETSTQPSAPVTSDEETVPQIKIFTKKSLPDKKKLVAWLETSYKHYKQRIAQGIVKVSLDPPKLGKMALYPWEFILSRYRDKKNLFLISKEPQYRIFMAVDTKNPFFNNCIDINDIRFADLHKYPSTVKNLLTNATDLKDNFCILCGLTSCWELIGSVTKICDQKESKTEIQLNNENPKDDIPEEIPMVYESADSNAEIASREQQKAEHETKTKDSETIPESSKWFVMTVEKDFDEIQFYNKGFFVKLESIIKAISVARSTGKTVRLSSQKCADTTGPQFGIYAIPNHNESCVFVGPYEKDESLGIETVKNIFCLRQQRRTRGVWITTKKLDNFQVIDNPLSFMPPKNTPMAEMMTLAGNCVNTGKNPEYLTETNEVKAPVSQKKTDLKRQEDTKILKPIKIRKTNGFFHLAPNGTLKQISPQKYNAHSNVHSPAVLDTSLTKQAESRSPLLSNASSILANIPPPTLVTIHKRPIAEIAPHVKIPEPCKKERGMFILKPEEINKRLLQHQMPSTSHRLNPREHNVNSTDEQEIEMDIENFLATAEECVAPNDDILIISDEETDVESKVNACPIKRWTKVWIECKTVNDLGWIPGRRNEGGLVSFEFPGFKYTEFYEKEEAFAKLNQVLSRKVYIPKNINLEWSIAESEQVLATKHMLKSDALEPDSVMTKRGIRRRHVLVSGKSLLKNEVEDGENSKVEGNNKESTFNLEKPQDCIEDLEKTSQLLEDEGQRLWNTLKTNSDNTEALDDLREQIAARLQSMVSNM
ncbi:hypothetical protein MSG28_001624 [Choristoneura fumiferana]|uniref:Uncharacterized protein n=1 Tax=Choristoneura fumiferana TaxID=7141 RepID=A0ACC0KVB2_CHOFU|nr:hypothetical protein MSG28_001624 [Choristoneura fumiferana]